MSIVSFGAKALAEATKLGKPAATSIKAWLAANKGKLTPWALSLVGAGFTIDDIIEFMQSEKVDVSLFDEQLALIEGALNSENESVDVAEQYLISSAALQDDFTAIDTVLQRPVRTVKDIVALRRVMAMPDATLVAYRSARNG